MSKKNGFTLAEIMIVLVIIGVLTAILLPVAIHNAPDENIMKFKKGNNTLGTVIRELVNSDEYYLNGDLGKMPNGEWVTKKDYFLRTFSEIVTVKKAVYPDNEDGIYGPDDNLSDQNNLDEKLDNMCKDVQNNLKNYIQTADDIFYYQYNENNVYGAKYKWIGEIRNPYYVKWDNKVDYISYCLQLPTTEEQDACVFEHTRTGFYFVKNVFCMDVDGINKGEDPFGYGIRVDGKIFLGARAKEWMNKSIQKGD